MNSLLGPFERIVEFAPAFDRRDPRPSKNYGVHSVELRMILKGALGAVQFVLYTGWHLPHVARELNETIAVRPTPADIGYHWSTPRYADHCSTPCCYLPDGHCYYDGSSLQAVRVFEILLREGSDGVWRELEKRYEELALSGVES